MKVRATKLGYYDLKRRRVGEVFDIPENLFSDKWMERLDNKKQLAGGRVAKPKPEVEEAPDEGHSTGSAEVI